MSSYGYRDAQGGYGQIRRPPVRPTITAPRSPNNRAGPLGVGPTPLGLSTRTPAQPTFTQDQVNTSLAANPYASKGGYEGKIPMTGPGPQPQQAAPAAPSAPNLSYDYSADPILNQIQALSSQTRSDAQANALALRKQLAIDYGDPEVANQFGDPATAQAAQQNPFGVRQQLQRSYDQGLHNLEEQYNQQNLFYGGARAKGLSDFGTDYQGQLAGAAGQEQTALGGINANLAAALAAAQAQDIQGQQGAADRAIQMALATGTDPGAPGPITPQDVNQYVDPTPPLINDPTAAPNAGDAVAPLPIGATVDPLVYALIGRKLDPRYGVGR
jgi:hypothetical protein